MANSTHHPAKGDIDPAKQLEAERLTAENLYQAAQGQWFPQLGKSNQQNNQIAEGILPSVSFDYSQLARQQDRDQNQFRLVNNQLAELKYAPPPVAPPAIGTAGSAQQNSDTAPAYVNPAQQESEFINAQFSQIQKDFNLVSRAARTTALEYSDIATQTTNKDPEVKRAATELETLYKDIPTKGFHYVDSTGHASPWQDAFFDMTQDQIGQQLAELRKPIDEINRQNLNASREFGLVSQTAGKAALTYGELEALESNGNENVSQAASDLLKSKDASGYFQQQQIDGSLQWVMTQQAINTATATALLGLQMPNIKPEDKTVEANKITPPPSNNNNNNNNTQTQPSNGGDAPAGQPQGGQDVNALSNYQKLLTQQIKDEHDRLAFGDPAKQRAQVIAGGGYYQVAQQLLGLDLHKRPTAEQAKQLKLLTIILQHEVFVENGNAMPTHLRQGQALLTDDNIRDAMDRLNALRPPTRQSLPQSSSI